MKRNKKQGRTYNKRAHITQLIILTILWSAVSILAESAKWFQNSWGDISFATVVYQMMTPLTGTESGIIVSYMQQVIPRFITRVVLAVLFYYMLVRIFSVVDISFNMRVLKKQFKLMFGKRFLNVMRPAFLIFLTSFSVYELGRKAVELGVDDFVADVMQSSTIFEDYYVEPKDTRIVFPDKKRNLILIFAESMENTFASVEEGGGKPANYIPELLALADEYVNFSSTEKIGGVYMNALSTWTIAGLLGATSGVPYKIPGEGPIPENAAGRYAEFLPGLTSMGDILEQNGYKNYFFCGSKSEFAGRDIYFRKHGNYEVKDYLYALEKGHIPEDYYAFWGMEDEKLFAMVKNELGQISQQAEPFNITMLTVDTHGPDGWICALCDDKYPQRYANAIACSSRQLYSFVEWAKQQEWYENTTIVIIGDHNSMVKNFWDDIGSFDRRIYNCFINVPDTVDVSDTKNRNVCTLDLFPTMLASLGVKIDGDRLALGTNAFSDKSTLLEEIGAEELDQQLSRYSGFYTARLVQKK